MLINAQGIVLKQRKIAGNRRMLVIFTKEYGKLSAGTSINEKSKSRSALALRPFTYAEYDIFKGRDSYSVNSATAIKSFYSIGEDLDRFASASTFISYLDRVVQEAQPMPRLFDMAMEFLESVSRAKDASETLLYAFIVKTFRILGVMPELGCCVNCGKSLDGFQPESDDRGSSYKLFSVSSGGVICEDCARVEKSGGASLIYKPSFDIIEVLCYFMAKPLSTFEKVRLKSDTLAMMREIISKYSEQYLGVKLMSDDDIPQL